MKGKYKFFGVVIFIISLVVGLLLILKLSQLDAHIQKIQSDNLTLYFSTSSIILYFSILEFINILFFYFLIKLTSKKYEKVFFDKKPEILKNKENDDFFNENEDKKDKEINFENDVQDLLVNINLEKEINKTILLETIFSNIANKYEIVQGIAFFKNQKTNLFERKADYAFYSEEEIRSFNLGEGLTGQVAKTQELLNINNVPKSYIKIISGLGNSSPRYLCIFPIIKNKETIGVVELASFSEFEKNVNEIFILLAEKIAVILDK